MSTFTTMQEVLNNIYINDLPEIAREYDVYGRFLEIKNNPNSDFNGIYFIYGSNKDMVMDEHFDIQATVRDINRDKVFFYRNCAVHKLTNNSDIASHSNIITILRHMELLNRLEDEYGIKLPDKITSDNLIYMRKLYCLIHDAQTSNNMRLEHARALKSAMIAENKLQNKNSKKYKMLEYFNNGYYDVTKGKMYNWLRRNFVIHKNKVSIEHLAGVSVSELGQMIVDVKYAKELEKELNKHPKVLYNLSSPFGKELSKADLDGTVNQQCVRLTYDKEYRKDILNIVNKVCYPDAYKINLEEMLNKYGQLLYIGVAEGDYENFSSLLTANKVPFCIDCMYTTEVPGVLNIIVPVSQKEMVQSICNRLCKEAEDLHIDSHSIRQISQAKQPNLCEAIELYGMSLDDKLSLLASEKVGDGNYVVVSGYKIDELVK